MSNKEKAQKSIELLRDAVYGVLRERRNGMTLGEIDDSLGLNFDKLTPNNNMFIKKFIESFLMESNPTLVKTEKRGTRRIYFYSE